jgi:hypothetical protein
LLYISKELLIAFFFCFCGISIIALFLCNYYSINFFLLLFLLLTRSVFHLLFRKNCLFALLLFVCNLSSIVFCFVCLLVRKVVVCGAEISPVLSPFCSVFSDLPVHVPRYSRFQGGLPLDGLHRPQYQICLHQTQHRLPGLQRLTGHLQRPLCHPH